jgi:SAM-dependent methyltransferase
VAGVGRVWLQTVVWLNAHLKSAAVRLTRLTGKSRVPLHPKHLVKVNPAQWWYLAHLQPGDGLLDIGCGNGMHTMRAAEHVAQAAGLDCDAKALQVAHQIAARKESLRLTFMRASAEAQLPFCDGAFDVVLLLDVIEHLYGRVPLLEEIRRVLRHDGRLLLSAPNRDTTWKRRLKAAGIPCYTDSDHKTEYTLHELLAELAAGGFRLQGKPKVIVYDTPWAGAIDLVGGLSLNVYSRLVMWKVRRAHTHPKETTGWRIVCCKA